MKMKVKMINKNNNENDIENDQKTSEIRKRSMIPKFVFLIILVVLSEAEKSSVRFKCQHSA